jgi:hypothetical protein
MSLLEKAREAREEVGAARTDLEAAVKAPDNAAIRRERGVAALEDGLQKLGEHDAALAIQCLLPLGPVEVTAEFKSFRNDAQYGMGTSYDKRGIPLARTWVTGVEIFSNQERGTPADVAVFLSDDGKLGTKYTVSIRDGGSYRLSRVFDGLGPRSSEVAGTLFDENATCLEGIVGRLTTIAEAGIQAVEANSAELRRRATEILERKQ